MTETPSTLLDRFRETVDPGAVAHTSGADLPPHWQDYLDPSTDVRVQNALTELRMIDDYLPEAAEAIAGIVVDAIIVDSPLRGVCRVLGCQVDGVVYPTWSNPPTDVAIGARTPEWQLFEQRAPGALVWVYQNVMDGLVDAYGFGGFYPSALMTTMKDQADTYGNGGWHDTFAARRDTGKVIEFFASGGGAYLLLDLNDDLSGTDPSLALLADFKDGSVGGPRPVELFSYLDAWMAIALGGDA